MNTTTNQIQGIKLSELGLKIKSVLDNAFNNLNFWVIADVSSHTPKPERNYHFFQLVEKDPDSNVIITKIESKAWGAGAEKIKEFESITGQKFTNGIQVLVNVNVVYSPNFGLQLELIGIEPVYIGFGLPTLSK
jgi:exodeoxyribonuclease VII large subunit